MRLVIAITGASGVIYGIKLVYLLKDTDIETHVVISDAAKKVIKSETDYFPRDVKNYADFYYNEDDLTAIINSGSFNFDATIIVPCSMKTLSAISNGYADNTITRVADVTLKERRTLIVVPRETPLRTVHLENMTKISREGGIILPAMPGFYHRPDTVNDQIDFILGKILDVLGIDNNLFTKWKQ